MPKRLASIAAILFAAALSCAAPASSNPVPAGTSEAVVTLDPAQTRIDFTLPGSVHTTRGTFHLQSGSMSVDPRSGKASGKIIVDASSADSGDSLRDARMKGSILEVGRYPDIVFVPESATGKLDAQGAFQGSVTGTLYLHGGSHQISMETQGQVEGDRMTATARFAVPYVEWGMEDPSMLFLKVSKSVDLKVVTAGHVTWIPGASVSSGTF